MANPFLKIDQKSGYEPLEIDDEEAVVEEVATQEPIDEATGEPFENGAPDAPVDFEAMDEVGGADPMVQPTTGAFAAPVAGPVKMDAGQFGKAFYEEISNPDVPLKTPQELIEWSKTVGQEIVPDDAFYEAYRNAAAARRDNRPVPNARINSLTPEEATAQGIPFSLSEVGTFLRQAGGALPFVDEAVSAAKALPDLVSGGTNAFNDSYRKNWEDANTMNDLDWETREGISTLGLTSGIIATMFVPGPAMATRLSKVKELGRMKAAGAPIDDIIKLRKEIVSSLGKDVAVGSAIGGATGAVYGTGEGTPDDRFGKTGEGAAFGAATGGLFQPAVMAGERVTRPLRERVAPLVDAVREKIATAIPRAAPSSSSSVRAIARRTSAAPETMRANAARQRELGTEPALFDVVDEPGRNLVGKAGQRDGTREQLQDFAEARTVALPERVQAQAGRISSDVRTPEALEEGILGYRDKEIDLALTPIRGEKLELTDEVTQILATREGQQAINAAIGMETDPAIRANFEALRTAARELNRIDPRLPPQARAQIMRQVMMGVNFDINASDKISRALKRRGESGDGGDARTLFQFANKVRDLARTNPKYVEAMETYGAQSRAANSINIGSGGKVGNENKGGYLNENADTYVKDFNALEAEPTARMLREERKVDGNLEIIGGREFPVTTPPSGRTDEVVEDLGEFANDPMARRSQYADADDEALFQQISDVGNSVDGDDATYRALEDELKRRGYATSQILDVMDGSVNLSDMLDSGPSYSPGDLRRTPPNLQEGTNNLRQPTIGFEPESAGKGTLNRRNLRYTLPDGRTVTGEVSWATGQNEAIVEVYGMNDWDSRANNFGADVMRDIGSEVNKLYPQLKFLSGYRATGASQGKAANPGLDSLLQKVPVDPSRKAPSEQRLARVGAATEVKREAGKGVPQAASVAKRIAISPEMQRKSTTMLGEQGATDLQDAMTLELRRVGNANAQRSGQGPGRGTDDIEGVESAINAMYNPTSPVTWTREVIRFMNKIGLTENDAQFIIDNVTDPKMTDQLIDQLEQAGLDQLRAKAYLDVVRNGLTRYAGTTEEN